MESSSDQKNAFWPAMHSASDANVMPSLLEFGSVLG